MSSAQHSRPLALVVVEADAGRESSCSALIESGYDTVGFADCENASAWLEEETPQLAVLAAYMPGQYGALLSVLLERGLVVRGAGPHEPPGIRLEGTGASIGR